MKGKKSFLIYLLSLMFVVSMAFVACAPQPELPKNAVLTLPEYNISLYVGDNYQVNSYYDGEEQLEYTSSSDSVASVSSSGLIEGKADGIAFVTVSAGELNKTIKVTVEKPDNKIVLNSIESNLVVGSTKTITAEVYTNANAVILSLVGKGEITITLTNIQNELITYQFKIIVN